MPARSTKAKKTARTSPVHVNPHTLAVAILGDLEAGRVSQTLIETTAMMPGILAAISDGESSSNQRPTIWSAIRAAHDRETRETSTTGKYDFPRQWPKMVAVLDAGHPDWPTDVEVHFGRIGFEVGLAFACFILTNQGAVAVAPDGQ